VVQGFEVVGGQEEGEEAESEEGREEQGEQGEACEFPKVRHVVNRKYRKIVKS